MSYFAVINYITAGSYMLSFLET